MAKKGWLVPFQDIPLPDTPAAKDLLHVFKPPVAESHDNNNIEGEQGEDPHLWDDKQEPEVEPEVEPKEPQDKDKDEDEE
ncbi:hypothetical protein DXG01_015440 [Tephrocybe rancida]|nr:hypothetical protein DXG01_015440 [Tephrocybe rancida]